MKNLISILEHLVRHKSSGFGAGPKLYGGRGLRARIFANILKRAGVGIPPAAAWMGRKGFGGLRGRGLFWLVIAGLVLYFVSRPSRSQPNANRNVIEV